MCEKVFFCLCLFVLCLFVCDVCVRDKKVYLYFNIFVLYISLYGLNIKIPPRATHTITRGARIFWRSFFYKIHALLYDSTVPIFNVFQLVNACLLSGSRNVSKYLRNMEKCKVCALG